MTCAHIGQIINFNIAAKNKMLSPYYILQPTYLEFEHIGQIINCHVTARNTSTTSIDLTLIV